MKYNVIAHNKVLKHFKEEMEENMVQNYGLVIVNIGKSNATNWKISSINSKFERIYGCRQTQLIGKNVNVLLPNIIAEYHDYFI